MRFPIPACAIATLFLCLLSRGAPVAAQTKQPAAKKSDAVAKVIIPYVTKHCVMCHGPKKKNADLRLDIFKDEATILKGRKRWHEVLRMVHGGEMPPEKQPRPDLKDTDAFLKAINDIFIAADTTGKRDPGRVTMRRLNRAEYNNTIRDLVGFTDFRPADDFPSDDVGHGFDNIGDVLTVSPVLMERYLAAAETIMKNSITVGPPPKPAVEVTSARFLQPSVRNPDKIGRFRSITEAKGTLFTFFKVGREGDFKARVRAHGNQVGKEVVKLALLVNGKQEKVFDVANSSGGKFGRSYDVQVHLKPGSHRIEAMFLNPYADPERKAKRALNVEAIQLEGPLDTRPPSHYKLLAHMPGASKEEAAREILTRFASRAYRRPAAKAEVDRLLKFVDLAQKNKESWEAGIQLAMQAVLCSSKFLFRVELDSRPDSKDPHPIDDYQLASRLSYFLWSTMPDDELFALAARKQLHQNLKPQVIRMLKDPRAAALTENFAAQWLHLRLLRTHAPDSKLFPDFDEALRSDMIRETELFFYAIVQEDRSILDLIDSNFTFMNARLARHYGIADTNGNRLYQKAKVKPGTPFPGRFERGGKSDEFLRVTFADDQRGGVLTQASILTLTSNPTRTSPVKRGVWVLDQILGAPPPPPPPNVPELESKGQLKGTLRERMEQHRKNPSCANCHARMDPIGFAFENFNAIGRFRVQDEGREIDASGVLPNGQKFNGPKDLKAILMGKKDLFSRALTEKMVTYGIGRGIEYYDKPAIDRIVSALSKNDFRFSTLMVEITQSEPFRMRRGKDQKD
ncbi:MAG: DUF1592 domain-containing protein [Planctomycetes bacterium]|nr:DUF1592 domain-containing protein [Planctomycetota bacterium]